MKKKTAIVSIAVGTIALSVFANIGKARFSAVVVDEKTGVPLADVPVIGFFVNRYMRWENASEEIVYNAVTDKNGSCKFAGKTNCGDAGVRVRNYEGYYDSEILTIPYTNKDCVIRRPVWEPDNVVVTLKLQKVGHPIPLFVKVARLKADADKIANNQGKFAYDFVESAWLPPFGHGKNADVEFSCRPRERLEDGKNFSYTAPRYRNSMCVELRGEDNGICVMPTTSATLKIRTAPPDGYAKGVTIWRQLSAGLNADEGYDEGRNYCFRIRTRRDEDGKIIESYYGKIYGDIELRQKYDGGIPDIVGVRFLYYLNPKSMDRNLEYKTGANLNPSKPNPIDGQFKP